jgi:hypothetical protein
MQDDDDDENGGSTAGAMPRHIATIAKARREIPELPGLIDTYGDTEA